MMYHFATLFDINYLSRGLCLATSLQDVLKDKFQLFVLALDNETIMYFERNPVSCITVIRMEEIENYFPELNKAKQNRSKVEYYFTLSPCLPLYILKVFSECERITTLDADLYFYSNPNEIFNKYDKNSVFITPHDFSPELQHLQQYGRYNVSFQSFPNSEIGTRVLEDWKEKCLNWCYDYYDVETGRFADQKYLDDWINMYPGIQPIDLATCGRAPWNISSTSLKLRRNRFIVGNEPLVYFHFHHLRINSRYIGHGLQDYDQYKISKPVRKMYSVYIKLLRFQNKKLLRNSDSGVTRDREKVENSGLLTIWRKEIGAFSLFNRVFFYNIIGFKSKYRNLRSWLHGKTN